MILSGVILLIVIGGNSFITYLRAHQAVHPATKEPTAAIKHIVPPLPAGWLQYTSPDKSFSVGLPCVPAPQSQAVNNETITLYRCTDTVNHIEYRVAYSMLPGDTTYTTSQIAALLEDTEKGVQLSNQGSTIVSSKSTTYDGYTTLDYVIKTSTGSYYTFRSIMANHSFLEIGTLSLTLNPLDYNQFVTSLRIGSNT